MSLNILCISVCEMLGTSGIATILLSVEDIILEEVIEHRHTSFNMESVPHAD